MRHAVSWKYCHRNISPKIIYSVNIQKSRLCPLKSSLFYSLILAALPAQVPSCDSLLTSRLYSYAISSWHDTFILLYLPSLNWEHQLIPTIRCLGIITHHDFKNNLSFLFYMKVVLFPINFLWTYYLQSKVWILKLTLISVRVGSLIICLNHKYKF